MVQYSVAVIMMILSSWLFPSSPGFSAKVSGVAEGAPVSGTVEGRGALLRWDLRSGDRATGMIYRPDLGATLERAPDGTWLGSRNDLFASLRGFADVKKLTARGPDKLDKIACRRYEFRQGEYRFDLWLREGTSIPARMSTPDGRTRLDFNQVKLAPPPEKRFEEGLSSGAHRSGGVHGSRVKAALED